MTRINVEQAFNKLFSELASCISTVGGDPKAVLHDIHKMSASKLLITMAVNGITVKVTEDKIKGMNEK